MKICIGGDTLGIGAPPRRGRNMPGQGEAVLCPSSSAEDHQQQHTWGSAEQSVPEAEGEMHTVENHWPLGTSVRKSPVDDIWASVG